MGVYAGSVWEYMQGVYGSSVWECNGSRGVDDDYNKKKKKNNNKQKKRKTKNKKQKTTKTPKTHTGFQMDYVDAMEELHRQLATVWETFLSSPVYDGFGQVETAQEGVTGSNNDTHMGGNRCVGVLYAYCS